MTCPAALDPNLALTPKEVFFKTTTRIDDTEELRDRIQRVAREGYEVNISGWWSFQRAWLTSFVEGLYLR
jgi:hypothetical protein